MLHVYFEPHANAVRSSGPILDVRDFAPCYVDGCMVYMPIYNTSVATGIHLAVISCLYWCIWCNFVQFRQAYSPSHVTKLRRAFPLL